MRYVITIRSTERGRKILERKKFSDYDKAMQAMDDLEDRWAGVAIVEFEDTNPFGR